jgi:hypothetical protein
MTARTSQTSRRPGPLTPAALPSPGPAEAKGRGPGASDRLSRAQGRVQGRAGMNR